MGNTKKINPHLIAGLALILAFGMWKPSAVSAQGASWQQPIMITVGSKEFVDYRALKGTGDAIYYQLTVTEPTRINITLALARSASEKFVPQVVLFQPSETTVGPFLPIQQPPQTIAHVYPVTQSRMMFDAFTQTSMNIRLEAQPIFPAAGTYTFAIYNAGSQPGQYKFTLNRGASLAQWHDAWQMPMTWWQDQTFAGFSWLTLITPILIILIMSSVYLRLDHHQLHVHKKYSPRLKKVKK